MALSNQKLHDICKCIRICPFILAKNFEFQYFEGGGGGGVQKNEYLWGYEDFEYIFF